MNRFLAPRSVLVVALLVACSATTAAAVIAEGGRDSVTTPAGYSMPITTQPTDRPVAVFLGDSFTEGSQVTEADRFATLVGARMGWRSINQGQGGTGYVADGPVEFPERSPFPDRVAQLVAMKPDVVIIAGGINDADKGYSTTRITKAVQQTLSAIKTGLPKAEIVVVGPYWPNGFPTASALSVEQIVKEQADALDLAFIDPIEEHWVTGSVDGKIAGNYATMTGPDHTHPTVAGQLNIARRMTGDLHRLQIN